MIDLRSDTVTKPSKAMLDAMYNAEVGDDVYGEDPTIIQLEQKSAEMLGMEAAIFAPSGTQTNLLALMSHCDRGDEYIVGQQAHTYRYEGGGAAVLGSIQPQPVENLPDGSIDLAQVRRDIKADDFHFAKTRLVCLENTHAGKALSMEYLDEAAQLCKKYQLAYHLDGARIFNAAVKHNVEVEQIANSFDSISVCLSKGLGAPVGSVLCGSVQLIDKARRHRKMLGGGMRQAGSLAAAAIFALDNNIQRLADDHAHAAYLAEGLVQIDEIKVEYTQNQTNMVFVQLDAERWPGLIDYMQDKGILISGRYSLRLVTHLDISEKDINYTINRFKEYFLST